MKKFSSKKLKLYSTVLLVVFLLQFLGTNTNLTVSSMNNNHDIDNDLKATLTDGIWIHDDAELASYSTPGGEGTPANPYVIEDLVIDTSDPVAIRIEDTTKHFDVVNCTVTAMWGIYLDNVTGATAEIRNNTAINCDAVGIYLYRANGTWIQDNILINNGRGMEVRESYVVFISNNYVSSEDAGIFIYRSPYASLTSNEMHGDGINLNFNQLDDLLTIAISTCTVNSEPVLFSKSESDFTTTSNYGQIIIINGTNINIVDQTLTNLDIGMSLWFSMNLEVSNCKFGVGDIGIEAIFVDTLTITDCEFDSLSDGIYTDQAYNYQIYLNNFEDSSTGVYVSGSGEVNIYKNNFYNNSQGGVVLDYCFECNIYWNNFTDNGEDTGYQALDDGRNVNFDNLWYNNVTMTGNWWNDYIGSGNYTIEGSPIVNYDLYPLAEPYYIIPEFSVSFWLVLASVMFFVVAIPILRKRK